MAICFALPAPGLYPALVFLHGCGGLISRSTGRINTREADWAARFNAAGYDAYGALDWLQAQDFVRPDRVGVVGWSEGGGVILYSLGTPSLGRPAGLPPERDFQVAAAFYPASCRSDRQPADWTTRIPLLALIGAEDVWTPLAPCQSFLGAAAARGPAGFVQAYPGAYHDFDWPDLKRSDRPEFTTSGGVVPITGVDPAARDDALRRVPAFLSPYLKR